MIYLRDGALITKAKIVSKNDAKLVDFANKNSSILDFKNFAFISSKSRRVGEDTGYFNGYYFQSADDYKINMFKLKKLITLRVITEALENSNVKVPKSFVQSSIAIELENFFSNVSDELQMIESIIDNPYFYDFIEKLYSDYKGFIEIFPYIDFKVVDYYTTSETSCESRLRELELFGGSSAINNKKILTKTREFISVLDR